VAFTIGTVVPVAVAVPVRVAPHCEFVGAEIATDADAGVSDVVLLEASVDDPDADTVTDDGDKPVRAPEPDGHTARVVARRHNCGASPIALRVAFGVEVYDGFSNSTRNSKPPATQALDPEPPDTGRPDKESTPFAGINTESQPGNTEPPGSNTDNRAALNLPDKESDPDSGKRKSTHS
jgi:hypothetical protein